MGPEKSPGVGCDAMKISCSVILLLLAMNCYADSNFYVSLASDQVKSSSDLGKIEVEGVGAVNLIARKNGNQLTVHAQGPDGKVIGKAETVVGLKQTPIYVLTDDGLKKVTIYWGMQ
jgi:hypothetical protein